MHKWVDAPAHPAPPCPCSGMANSDFTALRMVFELLQVCSVRGRAMCASCCLLTLMHNHCWQLVVLAGLCLFPQSSAPHHIHSTGYPSSCVYPSHHHPSHHPTTFPHFPPCSSPGAEPLRGAPAPHVPLQRPHPVLGAVEAGVSLCGPRDQGEGAREWVG